MKITVLIENNSRIDNYLIAEPGLSLLVEEGERKVLFDTGYSDAFIKNAKKLHIDLNKVTDIVISHGHNDHTRGLAFLNLTGTNLYAHPNIFDVKIDENNLRYGCPISQNELSNRYNLILSKKPVAISENIVFLGEIPGNKSQDIDDTALAFKGEKGVLYLCGKGIAHGYINNFAATKEKFFKLRDRDMYCTGDIVYMDEQSNLVYVGRSDNEIKVNGIRVNLEEITSLILHEFQFLNCITLLLSYNKIRKICMVISKSNENLLPLILTYIKRNVPQYMRPNYIYVTNNIYKLPNGKNDNKKMEKEILDIMLPDSEVKSAILIKIHEILSTYSLDKVEDDEDLLDAGIDSISLVNFLVEIEDCYNIEIDIMDKEIDGNFTILYICELVVKEKYGYLAKV